MWMPSVTWSCAVRCRRSRWRRPAPPPSCSRRGGGTGGRGGARRGTAGRRGAGAGRPAAGRGGRATHRRGPRGPLGRPWRSPAPGRTWPCSAASSMPSGRPRSARNTSVSPSRMRGVPSVEQSSTTTSCATHGDASTASMAAATVASSLYAGITTERQGRGSCSRGIIGTGPRSGGGSGRRRCRRRTTQGRCRGRGRQARRMPCPDQVGGRRQLVDDADLGDLQLAARGSRWCRGGRRWAGCRRTRWRRRSGPGARDARRCRRRSRPPRCPVGGGCASRMRRAERSESTGSRAA